MRACSGPHCCYETITDNIISYFFEFAIVFFIFLKFFSALRFDFFAKKIHVIFKKIVVFFLFL